MVGDPDLSATAGQAVYTPWTLRAYDAFVLGFSNTVLWRCPTRELEALYARNATRRHMDVGVGTGYFLDRTGWPVAKPDILLVDLNSHSLAAAAQRIRRYNPKTLSANVLEPFAVAGTYDSAGLCFLLHCLPGTIRDKAAVFDHIRPALSKGAKVFGATIVQGDAPRSWTAQALMDAYNRRGIFSNANDTAQDLEAELHKRFDGVRVTRRGAVAMFEARCR